MNSLLFKPLLGRSVVVGFECDPDRAPAVQQYSWYSSTAGTAVQQVQHTLVLDLCVRDVLDVYTAGTAETLMYLMYIQQVQQK